MSKESVIPIEIIEQRIFMLRDEKVMLDFHLAEMYGVETRSLKRAVRRNILRFPEDFCFELTAEEWQILKCQFGTSSWGGIRHLPFAFTEQGVAMLSGVLHSERAIKVNVQIMRAFVKLRQLLSTHKELAVRFRQLERKIEQHDEEIQTIFEAIRRLMSPPPEPPKRRMGFGVEEPKAKYSAVRKRA